MSNAESSRTKPCRGIIVFDTCELVSLATPYDRQKIDKNSPIGKLEHTTGSYLDILPILARHGFRIIIPEMVSAEAANILANAVNLRRYFPNGSNQYSTQPLVQKFCLHASADEYENIVISQAYNQRENYAQYIQELRKAVREAKTDNWYASKRILRNIRITSVNNAYKGKTKNFGDVHCFNVIEDEIARQKENGECIPIFFFSTDGEARNRLREIMGKLPNHPPVSVLASDGFLSGLDRDVSLDERTNVLTALGLTGSGQDCWAQIAQTHIEQKLPEYCTSTNDYQDSPIEAYGTGCFPFAKAVQGLAQELVDERQQRESEQVAAPKQSGAIDKFRAKFGGDYLKGLQNKESKNGRREVK